MLGSLGIFFLLTVLGASGQTKQPELMQFLQPDNVGDPGGSGGSDRSRRCDRTCVAGEKPKLCYYKFTLENYHTMGSACGSCPTVMSDCFLPQCVTADGYERGIYTVNRRMPGPSIQVCLGDRIVIDLLNLMPGRTTTIHFHGLLQQGTNHMDGVPSVTQCPITEGATFRYDFVTKEYGTYFWHSHDGLQKMDGLLGSLIVRQPKPLEPNAGTYDRDLPEHVLLITDWMEVDGDQKFPGLRTRAVGQEPTSYLVNGKGRLPSEATLHKTPATSIILSLYNAFMDTIKKTSPKATVSTATSTPLTVYTVTRGMRYRMRMIGGTCLHCPAEVVVEGHRLRVIAVDGSPVKPVYVDKIVILPGERYDFVLEATQTSRAYWIHVRGVGPCTAARAYQLAVLKYADSNQQVSTTADPGYNGLQMATPVTLNPVGAECGPSDRNVCVNQLKSAIPVDPRLMAPNADLRVVLGFDFHEYTVEQLFRNNTYHRFLLPIVPILLTGFINKISNVLPASPILTQTGDIDQQSYCAAGTNGNTACNADICECFHLLRLPHDKVIEMVFAHVAPAPDDLHHPFHMHGHKFHVIKLGTFPDHARGAPGVAMLRNFELEPHAGRSPGGRASFTPRDLNSSITSGDEDVVFMEGGRQEREEGWFDDEESRRGERNEKKKKKKNGNKGRPKEEKEKGKKDNTWFPSKDSVAVPSAGYAVTRFISNNPGYWMIHCHFVYHQVVGMNLVMQVGEPSMFNKVPDEFPKCGGFGTKVDISQYV